ncbi:MAG TPA: PCRF domain-containing protein [Deltaproteobacteria bacterium]|nr:PCRF domain-containing protein [Deltaproteobacteria bacterium]
MVQPPGDVVLDDWIDRDLTEAVEQGGLPPAFAVGDVVSQAEDVLKAIGTRSPVLVGARGIGKTAIVYELIRRAHDRIPGSISLLREARVVQLSLRAISAKFKEKSDATNFFADLCAAIVTQPEPVVPFIRDIHLAYALDWEPTLHQLVSQLEHPILAEGLPREFDQLLEYWTDLTEHLVAIPMREPDQHQMRTLLSAWGTWTESQTGRGFEDGAHRTALELTARFMGDRPFPRKAIDLLRQTVDFLGEGGHRPVSVRDVVRRFSQLTRVPPRLVDPDEQLDLAEVHTFVSERLLGQQEAVDAVVRMIALMKAGLADLRRPFGTFLFVGPTGVGKTWCAQLLAEYLFGDRHRIVRVNMAEYTEPHHALTVFGNPHAHSVVDQRGVLSRRLQGNPFGVLLLDEFEKADPKVHDGFLQLFDEGRYINGRSETVSVTSMIVIATSNAGAEVFRESGLGFERPSSLRELDRELDRRLHRTFRFELINRFDRVVHFHPLDRACIRSIARRELAELADRDGLLGRGLEVEVDAEVLDWLVAHGYHPHWGARFLRREIERHVAGTLAEFIVRERPPRGSRLAIGVRYDRIDARTVSGPQQQAAPSQTLIQRRVVLEPEVLFAEGQTWLTRFEPLIAESETRRQQASELIEASATPGFWDDAENAQDVLRRYKTLDARLAADRRLLKPVDRLRRLIEADEDLPLEELAELLRKVARSYRRWIDIGSEASPAAAWVMLGPADSVVESSAWLTDLVGMYRGWFRRKGLTYELVAEEIERGQPRRLVMEVEGAGVLKLLEMEQGEHRRRGREGQVERAMVEVIPRRDGPVESSGAVVEDARRTRGVAILRRAARVRLDLPIRGLNLKLYGTGRDSLELLARDLGAALASPRPSLEIARTYGIRGGAVQDPRTSASTSNLKDVLRGNLEPFLQAWEVR